jgi:hypothetical protein
MVWDAYRVVLLSRLPGCNKVETQVKELAFIRLGDLLKGRDVERNRESVDRQHQGVVSLVDNNPETADFLG